MSALNLSTDLASCSKGVRQPISWLPVPRPSRVPMLIWPLSLLGLFDLARLEVLPEALADYQKSGDPNVVARALLAQINYTADVAANMPPHTYTTGGIFRFAWRRQQIHNNCPQAAHCLHVPALSLLRPACTARLRIRSFQPSGLTRCRSCS